MQSFALQNPRKSLHDHWFSFNTANQLRRGCVQRNPVAFGVDGDGTLSMLPDRMLGLKQAGPVRAQRHYPWWLRLHPAGRVEPSPPCQNSIHRERVRRLG